MSLRRRAPTTPSPLLRIPIAATGPHKSLVPGSAFPPQEDAASGKGSLCRWRPPSHASLEGRVGDLSAHWHLLISTHYTFISCPHRGHGCCFWPSLGGGWAVVVPSQHGVRREAGGLPSSVPFLCHCGLPSALAAAAQLHAHQL